jgi:hypothetical protein
MADYPATEPGFKTIQGGLARALNPDQADTGPATVTLPADPNGELRAVCDRSACRPEHIDPVQRVLPLHNPEPLAVSVQEQFLPVNSPHPGARLRPQRRTLRLRNRTLIIAKRLDVASHAMNQRLFPDIRRPLIESLRLRYYFHHFPKRLRRRQVFPPRLEPECDRRQRSNEPLDAGRRIPVARVTHLLPRVRAAVKHQPPAPVRWEEPDCHLDAVVRCVEPVDRFMLLRPARSKHQTPQQNDP